MSHPFRRSLRISGAINLIKQERKVRAKSQSREVSSETSDKSIHAKRGSNERPARMCPGFTRLIGSISARYRSNAHSQASTTRNSRSYRIQIRRSHSKVVAFGTQVTVEPRLPLGRQAFTWYRNPSWQKSVARVAAVRATQSSESDSGVWPISIAASNSEIALVIAGATPNLCCHSRATAIKG